MTPPVPTPSQINALALSLLRTFAAIVAGFLITLLVTHGLNVDPSASTELSELLTALFTAGYYLLVRVLEHFVSAHFGWLLLAPAAPSYTSARP